MGRYEKMFQSMREEKRGAFVPFTVIGDPTLEASADIIEALIAGGADALELGIPFSDPVADGPTIQAAAVRAIDAGATPQGCFEVLKRTRGDHPDIPMGLLVYANLVVANGEAAFFARARDAGVDSVLIADLPTFEAARFVEVAVGHDVAPVFIAPPNVGDERLGEIAKMTRGYTYVVARAGVTGCDQEVDVAHKSIFQKLKDRGAPPAMLGFGIATPDHVKTGLAAGADGVISGSAVVNRVAAGAKDLAKLKAELISFVKSMREATHPA
jgi:tryptophan synthase alpha chain